MIIDNKLKFKINNLTIEYTPKYNMSSIELNNSFILMSKLQFYLFNEIKLPINTIHQYITNYNLNNYFDIYANYSTKYKDITSMSLRERQSHFVLQTGKLINFVFDTNLEMTIGPAYAKSGYSKYSPHYDRLGIKFNPYNPITEDYLTPENSNSLLKSFWLSLDDDFEVNRFNYFANIIRTDDEILKEKQSDFVQNLGKLIQFAYDSDLELTFGDAYCTTGHIKTSKHYDRLAIDLNLFINGKYQTSTDAHTPLGEYWKSLDSECTWGGDFRNSDGNHYSYGEK